MKIESDSDDNLPLNKAIEIPMVTIVIRAVFPENTKYYPQVLLDECLYKIQKWYAMKELMSLKELSLTKHVHRNSVIFVTIGIS